MGLSPMDDSIGANLKSSRRSAPKGAHSTSNLRAAGRKSHHLYVAAQKIDDMGETNNTIARHDQYSARSV